MKITHSITLRVLAKKEEPSKDGSKVYKRLAVLTKDYEAGMLPCSDEIYDVVVPGRDYQLVGCYNDKYDSYSVVSVMPVEDDNGKPSGDDGEKVSEINGKKK